MIVGWPPPEAQANVGCSACTRPPASTPFGATDLPPAKRWAIIGLVFAGFAGSVALIASVNRRKGYAR